MNSRNRRLPLSCLPALALLGFLFVLPARADEAAQMSGLNAAQMKFTAFPGMPTCASGSVATGDPTKGPSIILAKMAAGCTFPWHWHTPAEHVMIVSGAGRMEMKDAKPVTLTAGGFALMPSKHVHQFKCVKTCLLYVYSDTIFDMHYVDDKGTEITPDEALKKVKETAAKAAP